MPPIETIGVLGGGVMGAGIAQSLAVGGATVTVRDIEDKFIEAARSTIVDGRYGLKRGVERGKTSQEDADARGRLGAPVDVAVSGEDDEFVIAVASRGRRRHALQLFLAHASRVRSLR